MPNCERCRGAYQTGLKQYRWAAWLGKLAGVICVSEWTRQLLIQGGYIKKDANCEVFPNGVNCSVFYPGNKKEARIKMNIRQDDFVVCFVGGFDDNKGAERLVQALNLVDSSIKAIFIGRDGPKTPVYDNAIFIGQCDNMSIPDYLRVSDCFVLPTKSEGCCNAILEALACGVPVISSDLPFNDGILDETNSIRVDPTNVSDIASAIKELKDDPERLANLASGAKMCADRFDISSRAKKIYMFMEKFRSDKSM
jgi:glycosyltransferase involved in cell wall biosynthesis